MDYDDFELEIGRKQGETYPVAVIRSPAGEARAALPLPFDPAALDLQLAQLENAVLRSQGGRRRIVSDAEAPILRFGQALFAAVMRDDVRSCFDSSRREARRNGRGLRIKLRIQAPELAALPWEFLCDREDAYLSLSNRTPIVRYVEVPHPPQPLMIAPPLRILAVVSGPNDLEALDAARERAELATSLRPLTDQGLVEIHWLPAPTRRELQRAMRGGPWHVFHFVGHGGFDYGSEEGVIALCRENGSSDRVTASQLAGLLSDHEPLRFALLNACEGARSADNDLFSSAAATLVRRGLPAVVAMQYPISDRAAIEFTSTFYECVTESLPIDAAVAEARKAISNAFPGSFEWATPVLHMRSPDGRLIQFDRTERTKRQETPSGVQAEAEPAQRQEGLPTLLAPKDSHFYCASGLEWFSREEWGRAKNDFEEALRLDPRNRIAADYLKRVEKIFKNMKSGVWGRKFR